MLKNFHLLYHLVNKKFMWQTYTDYVHKLLPWTLFSVCMSKRYPRWTLGVSQHALPTVFPDSGSTNNIFKVALAKILWTFWWLSFFHIPFPIHSKYCQPYLQDPESYHHSLPLLLPSSTTPWSPILFFHCLEAYSLPMAREIFFKGLSQIMFKTRNSSSFNSQ